VPPTVVTVIARSAIVADGGETAVIWVAESTVKLLASPVTPNVTLVAPVRFVPVITTLVPPLRGPDDGDIAVTAGAGAV
jgi:hypothetical protein